MSSQIIQQDTKSCQGEDNSSTKTLSIHEQAAVQELKEMSGNNSWIQDQLEVVNIKTLSQQLTNMTKHTLPPASSSDKHKNNKLPARSNAQQKNRYLMQKQQRSMSITSGNCTNYIVQAQTQGKGEDHSNSNSINRLDIQDVTSESSRMVSLSEDIDDSTQQLSSQQQTSQGLPPQYPQNNSLRRSPLDRVTLYPSRQAQNIFNPYKENESSSGWNSQQQQQQQIQQQYSNRTSGENIQKNCQQYSIQMQYYQHHQLYQFQAPSKQQQQQNQQIPCNFQNESSSSSFSQQSSGSLSLPKKYQSSQQQSSQQSLLAACSSQQSTLLENSPQFLVRLKSKFLKSSSQNKRKLHSVQQQQQLLQQQQQQKQQLMAYSHDGNQQISNAQQYHQNSLNEHFTENSNNNNNNNNNNNLAQTGSQFFQPILNCFLADKLRLHDDIKNKRSSQQLKSSQVSSFSCKRTSGKNNSIQQQQQSNLLFRSPSESKSSFMNANAGNQEGENINSTNSTTANSSQHCSQQTRRPSSDYQFYQQHIPSRPSTSNCFQRVQEQSNQVESSLSNNQNLLLQERLVFYQDNEKENTPFLKKKQWVNPAFDDQTKISSSYQPTLAFDDRKMSIFNKPVQRGRISSVLRENNCNVNNILAQKENLQGDYSKRKPPTRERQKSFDDGGNYSEGEQKSKVKLEVCGVKRGRNIYSSSQEQKMNNEIPMLECSGKRLRE